ncbi:hypothetical protein N8298_01940 [Flavobacteriaceae bacterium]|nr:hypothetical protein [Flavobacteriaceae bacterium]
MIATFFTKSNPIHYVFAFIYLFGLFLAHLNYNVFSFLIGAFSLFLLLTSVLLANFIISKNDLNKKNNYSLVAICFFIGLFMEQIFFFDDILIANVFLLLAIRKIYSIRNSININKKVFDASFWILISSVFYIPTLYFFIVLIIALILYSHFNLKNLVVVILAIISATTFLYLLEIINSGYLNPVDFINLLFIDFPTLDYISSFYENVSTINWPVKIIVFFSFFIPLIFIFIWNRVIKTNERRRTTTLILLTAILALIIYISNLNSMSFIFLFFPLIIIFTSCVEQARRELVKNLVLSIGLLAPYVLILF